MKKSYLIYNLDQNRYVSGKDDSVNIQHDPNVTKAKCFDSIEDAELFLELNNVYENYYTIIEALSKD